MNVYGSCITRETFNLWEEIEQIKRTKADCAWNVVGDFNALRRPREKKSNIIEHNNNVEIERFNEFIKRRDLKDILIISRWYTWYRKNGMAKSRLDRILVM